jgi:PEGA domain
VRIRASFILGCLIVAWLAALSPSTAEAQRTGGGRAVATARSSGVYYPRAYYPRYYPRYYYPRYYYPRYYYPGFYPGYYPGFYPGFGIGFGYPGYGVGFSVGFAYGYPGYGYGYPGYGYGYGYPWGYYGGYPYAPYYFDNSSEVRIQVTPRDAEVYIDGRFAGHVDDYDGTFQRLRVEPGAHEIVLFHERYRTHTEKRYLSPRSGYKIQHAMIPLGPGDASPARPAPDPATTQPERRPDREPGYGYGERQYPQSSRFGTLSIRVQPAGAEVFVDGERWNFPESSDRLILELSEGPHRIEIRKEGHEPYVSTVRIRAGEAATLNVSLIKGPGASALRTSSRRG